MRPEPGALAARPRLVSLILPLLLVAAGIAVWRFAGQAATDDAFITYRYSYNLLARGEFVFNPGERVLSTTAPGYALLLALLALPVRLISPGALLAAIPAISNAAGVAALVAGGWALSDLCRRQGLLAGGWIAAFTLALAPMLVMTLGMESAVSLALVCLAFAAYARGALAPAFALVGFATCVRFDNALPAAVLGFAAAWGTLRSPGLSPAARLRRLARAYGACLAVVLPFVLALALYFGSPIPVTLQAKVEQTYYQALLQPFPTHWRFWLSQHFGVAPGFYLLVGGALLGVAITLWRARWAVPFLAWGLLYLVAYTALAPAEYVWYYAPMLPAIALMAGVGLGFPLERLTSRSPDSAVHRLLAYVATALIFVAVGHALVRALPLTGSQLALFGKRMQYPAAAAWLAANARPGSTLGLEEAGYVPYYFLIAGAAGVRLLGALLP